MSGLIELTEENFVTMTNTNEVTVIDFYADWCGPCRSFAPIFASVAEQNSDVTFAKVNIDNQRELAQTFAVRSIPTVVLIKKNVVVYSEPGSMSATSLQSLVDQAKQADVSQAGE